MSNAQVCPICGEEVQATKKAYYVLTENGWEQDVALGCSVDVYCKDDHELFNDINGLPTLENLAISFREIQNIPGGYNCEKCGELYIESTGEGYCGTCPDCCDKEIDEDLFKDAEMKG